MSSAEPSARGPELIVRRTDSRAAAEILSVLESSASESSTSALQRCGNWFVLSSSSAASATQHG